MPSSVLKAAGAVRCDAISVSSRHLCSLECYSSDALFLLLTSFSKALDLGLPSFSFNFGLPCLMVGLPYLPVNQPSSQNSPSPLSLLPLSPRSILPGRPSRTVVSLPPLPLALGLSSLASLLDLSIPRYERLVYWPRPEPERLVIRSALLSLLLDISFSLSFSCFRSLLSSFSRSLSFLLLLNGRIFCRPEFL